VANHQQSPGFCPGVRVQGKLRTRSKTRRRLLGFELLEDRRVLSVLSPQSYDFEPNDTRAEATDLGLVSGTPSWENLEISSPEDRDWFTFQTQSPAADAHYVEILFTHSTGDLDLRLYDAAGQALRLAESETDHERIDLQGLPTGTYYVEIWGHNGATNSYDLRIAAPPDTLEPDRFEGNAPSNDTRVTATDLGKLSLTQRWDGLTIHNGDQDWFQFQTQGPSTDADYVQILFSRPVGTLKLQLYDAQGNPIRSGIGILSNDWISLEGLAAGTYYVEIRGDQGAENFYELTIAAPPEAFELDRFEGNGTRVAAAKLGQLSGMRDWEALTIHSTADHDWFEFQTLGIASDAHYVEISFSHSVGDLGMRLYDAQGKSLRLAASTPGGAQISLQGLAAGTYYVEIWGYAGARNDYDLAIEAPPETLDPDRFEPNDTRAAATDLGLVSGAQRWAGLTVHNAADRDWFTFLTQATSTDAHYVKILFSHSLGDLELQLYDAEGNALRSAESITNDERISLDGLAAGRYYVAVWGYGDARNGYELAILSPIGALPPDRFESNNIWGDDSALNSYDLAITAPSSPFPPDRFESNNTRQTAMDLGRVSGTQHWERLTIDSATDRDWFRFETCAPSTDGHFVEIQFSHSAGPLYLVLYNAQGDELRGEPGNAQISLQGLEEGAYYIQVLGDGGVQNAYVLTATAPGLAIDFCEPNDTFAEPADLGQVSGTQGWATFTIDSAMDRDWFKFQTRGHSTDAHYVEIRFSHSMGDLDLRLYDAWGNVLRQAVSESDNERICLQGLAAGTYYVEIRAYRGAPNRYDLAITAPTSELDRFEPNDTRPVAATLGPVGGTQRWEDLTVDSATDVDWFEFQTLKGSTEVHYVEILFSHFAGELDLQLYDAGGQVLRQADSESDNERISLQGLAAGRYYVKVWSDNHAQNRYDLTIAAPPCVLPSDCFEPNDCRVPNDDDDGEATDLGPISGTRRWEDLTVDSATDVDWFRFQTQAPSTDAHYVEIQFVHSAGDLDLQLYDDQGNPLRLAVSATDNERINLEGLAAGTYYIEISGYECAPNRYDLMIAAPFCALPSDGFEPNGTRAVATDLGSISGPWRGEDLTIDCTTDRDWFQFQTQAPATDAHYVEILDGSPGGGMELRLYDAVGTPIRYGTSGPDSERIRLVGLPAGAYFLEVGGHDGAPHTYELAMVAPSPELAPDRFEPNDTRSAAADLGQLDGQWWWEGLTFHRSTDRDWFRFQTQWSASDAHYVEIRFNQAVSDLDVVLYDAQGDELRLAASGTDHKRISLAGLPAGTYYVKAVGHDGVRNHYDLSIVAPSIGLAADRFEPNDTCGAGTDLGQVSGTQRWERLTIDSNADRDWFGFQTQSSASDAHYVEILFSHSAGDLDLRLYDAAGQALRLAESETENERIDLQGLAAGIYCLEIRGADGAQNSYDLVIAAPSGTPAPDRFEGNGTPNDTLAAAADLGQVYGESRWEGLTVHSPTDRDWFIFQTLGASTDVHYAELRSNRLAGDLDLRLYDAQGHILRRAATAADTERISLQGLAAGTYYVEIWGDAGARNDYDLAIVAPAGVLPPDRFERDKTVDLGQVSGMQHWDGLTIHQATDRDWFQFQTRSPSMDTHYVEIHFSHSVGDLDLRLYNAQGDRLRLAENASDHERIGLQGLAAGTYYVEVLGYGGAQNTYDLTIVAPSIELERDRLEPNDTRGEAADLGLVSGTLHWQDLTVDHARDCDWFKFQTQGPSTDSHYVEVLFRHSAGDLGLQLYDAQGNGLRQAASGADSARISLQGLAAGTYYVESWGYDRAPARYDLTIVVPTGTWSPDRFEPNDTREAAADLDQTGDTQRWEGLTIHNATDEDWFQFQTRGPATDSHYIEILFSHSVGNLDLQLYDAQGESIRSGTSVTDNERINLQELAAGTYYVEVLGADGAQNTYDLIIVAPSIELEPDRLEPNDTQGAAADLGLISGTLHWQDLTVDHARDCDWFKFQTQGPSTDAHYVEVLFRHSAGDLGLQLYDAQGNGLRQAATGADSARISLEGLAAGTYYVESWGYNGAQNRYDLTVAVPMGVWSADRFEPNDTRAAAMDLGQASGTQRWEALTVDSPTDRDWFMFQSQSAWTDAHYVEVLFSHSAGDLDLRLYDAQGDHLRQAESSTDNERINLQGLAAGTYYVEIRGRNGAQNGYVLAIAAPCVEVPPDRFETNKTDATAADLRQVSGSQRWEGLTIHSGTDRDRFQFQTLAPSTDAHHVEILFSHSAGDLDLRLYDAQGNCLRQAESVTDRERISLQGLAAGTYTIEAWGYGGAQNHYDLAIVAPTDELLPDRFEPNGTDAMAADLRSVSGAQRWESLTIHSATDRDWFQFQTRGPATDAHYVEIHFSHSVGDLDLWLYDAHGELLRSGTTAADNERIRLQGLAAGTYYVKVEGYGGARNTYDLAMVVPSAELDADRFEPNNTETTARDLHRVSGAQRWEGLTIDSAADRDWFQFQTQGPATDAHYVQILFSHSVGDMDVRLYDAAGHLIRSGMTADDDERISLQGLAAGSYYVEIAGYGGARNTYALAMATPSAALPADRFEPNDTPPAATNLRQVTGPQCWDDLTIHDAIDRDWFTFQTLAPSTGAHYVEILFSHSVGDLDLRLYDAQGNSLRSATGVNNHERISLQGLAAGTYSVVVWGTGDARNRYKLAMATPTDALPPDRFEANDTDPAATDLRQVAGTQRWEGLTIHNATDEDWFQFETQGPATDAHYVQILFSHAVGDLDLQLYDAWDQLIRSGTSATDNERISLDGLPTGRYYVKVEGCDDARNSYELAIAAPSAELAADRFEPNDQTAADLRQVSGTQRWEGLTIHNATDGDWFQFETQRPATDAHYVEILFSHSVGNLDLQLYDMQGKSIGSGTSVTDNERISLDGLATGRYYVKVGGYNGARNSYELAMVAPVSELLPDCFDPNDTRQTAADLRQVGGTQRWEGLTIHNTTDEDWFQFQTQGPATDAHYVEILFSHSVGNLDLQLYDAQGESIGSGTSVTDNERISLDGLATGRYYVKVGGYDGARNSYELAMVTPVGGLLPDDFEPNDTRATAGNLRKVGGLQQWEGLTIHSTTDRDWFTFQMQGPATESHFVEILFSHSVGDLDLRLYSAKGSLLRSATSTSNNERIGLHELTAGTYYLEVWAQAEAVNGYELAMYAPFSATVLPTVTAGLSWQAPGDCCDVNADGVVSPSDALAIINEINRNGIRELASRAAADVGLPYYDVNADGHLTAADVLFVVNFLNTNVGSAEGEAGLPDAASPAAERLIPMTGNALATSFDWLPGVSGQDATWDAYREDTVRVHASPDKSEWFEPRDVRETAVVEPGRQFGIASLERRLLVLDAAAVDQLSQGLENPTTMTEKETLPLPAVVDELFGAGVLREEVELFRR
jgi:hypothetical protein